MVSECGDLGGGGVVGGGGVGGEGGGVRGGAVGGRGRAGAGCTGGVGGARVSMTEPPLLTESVKSSHKLPTSVKEPELHK
jgi:hypothetical protein